MAGVCTEAFSMVSILIGLYRYRKPKMAKTPEDEKAPETAAPTEDSANWPSPLGTQKGQREWVMFLAENLKSYAKCEHRIWLVKRIMC